MMTFALPKRSPEPPDGGLTLEVDQTGVACATASGLIGRSLARQMGLPVNGCVAARLRILATDPDDALSPTHWYRSFGSVTTRTTVALAPSGELLERVGQLTLRFSVSLDDERLELDLASIDVGGRRLDPRRFLTVAVIVVPTGTDVLTTVDIDAGRLGRLSYTASMRVEVAA